MDEHMTTKKKKNNLRHKRVNSGKTQDSVNSGKTQVKREKHEELKKKINSLKIKNLICIKCNNIQSINSLKDN